MNSVWAFRIKAEENQWTQDKARGCCDGRTQIKGTHYNDGYSPTPRLSTVKATQSLSIKSDMTSRQVDIDGAFLYGKVERGLKLFMRPFQGFEEYEWYFDETTNKWLRDVLICMLVLGMM